MDATLLGSIEYGVDHFGSCRTIVVVGHEDCGAVKEAVDYMSRKVEPTEALGFQGSLIAPLLHSVLESNRAFDSCLQAPTKEHLIEASVRVNIALTAQSLYNMSPVVKKKVDDRELDIFSFRYDINSPFSDDPTGQKSLEVIPRFREYIYEALVRDVNNALERNIICGSASTGTS